MGKSPLPQRGPGQGRLRRVALSETIRCWRCGGVIVEVTAVGTGGRWEHGPNHRGEPSCPPPDSENSYGDDPDDD